MADTLVSGLSTAGALDGTETLLVIQGSGAGASKKATLATLLAWPTYGGPTFVIASSDASAAVKAAADYVCDGTADNVEIQAALDALPSTGGKVLFTFGRYWIASQVQITKHGVIFEGVGYGDPAGWTEDAYATTFYPVAGITGSVIRVSTGAIGTTNPVAACQLKNFMVDGAAGTTTPVGSSIDGVQYSSFAGLVENVRTCFTSGRGFYVVGKTTATTWSTYDTQIKGLWTHHNTLEGLYLDNFAEDLQLFAVVTHHNKGDGLDDRGSSNQFFGVHAYDNGDGGGADGSTNYNVYVANTVARTKFTGCKFEHSEGRYGVMNLGWETAFTGCNFHNNGEKWAAAPSSAVTFTDAGDLVTLNDHRLLNGDALQFSSITSTTGISINTTYYVVGRTTNTFQVASSVGGSALALTTNGSGVLVRGDGGNSRGQLYINGGMVSVKACVFGIKNNDYSVGSAIEIDAASTGNSIVGNSFQAGNADTSGFWNTVPLWRNGAIYNPSWQMDIHISGNYGAPSNWTTYRNEPNLVTPGNAGELKVYAVTRAGRMLLEQVGPAGVETALQPAIFGNGMAVFVPATGTTIGGWGGWAKGGSAGTVDHPAPSAGVASQIYGTRHLNAVTTTNQAMGIILSDGRVLRGNAARVGGFFFMARFVISAWPANTVRLFVGLSGTSTECVTSDTLQNNSAGFWHITTDGANVINFATRDGTTTNRGSNIGSVTLGAGQAFDAYIWCKPNDSTLYYRLYDINADVVRVDSSTATNLPVNTTMLRAQVEMSNGTANTTVNTVGILVSRVYLETDL